MLNNRGPGRRTAALQGARFPSYHCRDACDLHTPADEEEEKEAEEEEEEEEEHYDVLRILMLTR